MKWMISHCGARHRGDGSNVREIRIFYRVGSKDGLSSFCMIVYLAYSGVWRKVVINIIDNEGRIPKSLRTATT